MKIAYVVDRYPRFSATSIVDEIRAHEEAGVEVEIYSLQPPSDTHFHASISHVSAPVHYLSGSGSADEMWTQMQEAGRSFPDFWSRLADVRERDARTIVQAIELARLAGQNGVLHLHAHYATAPTTVARLAASLANITYTFTAHTEDLIGAEIDDADLKTKIRDANGTITENDFSLEYVQQAFGAEAKRVERVYNGIRTESLPFTSPGNRPRLVVAVGPLIETSGFEFLIDAVAKLTGKGQHLHCHIFGAGPLESELDKMIVKHNLRDVVRISVTSSSDETQLEVRKAAIAVAPSVVASDGTTSGLPSILLEAMTAGTPCISTDVGGIPEVIVDGQTGIQVPQRDADALAKAIDQLLGDDVMRVRLALKARVLVESEFNVHRNAERMRAFFGQYAGDGSMRPGSLEATLDRKTSGSSSSQKKSADSGNDSGNGITPAPEEKPEPVRAT